MEQRIPQPSGSVSEEDYLRMEELAKTKHEYRNGRIIDMAGGTAQHAQIAMNMGSAIHSRLKGKPCNVYGSDLRVRIDRTGNYNYPDLTIACEPLEFNPPNRQTTIVNPRLVIEVTSRSTESDDRGEKSNDYRQVPSLEEYVLVSQERYQVETFYRQPDGVWAFGPSAHRLDQAVTLRSIEIEILLSDIYARVELSVAQAEVETA